MAARGRVPPREHTLDILAILLGVVLLVFLGEGAGMAAPVALAPNVASFVVAHGSSDFVEICYSVGRRLA